MPHAKGGCARVCIICLVSLLSNAVKLSERAPFHVCLRGLPGKGQAMGEAFTLWGARITLRPRNESQ